MNACLYAFLLITLVTFNVRAQDEDLGNKPARLLVDKRVSNQYLVENEQIQVNYKVYNVGDKPAVNVIINDHSLPKEYFTWVNSTNQIKIAKVQPSSLVERTLIFTPKSGVWGRFNFTVAEVVYNSEGDSNSNFVFSSEPGVNYIFSTQEYQRRFSLHLYEWGVFILISLPSLLIPFSLFYRSKAKYNALASKNK